MFISAKHLVHCWRTKHTINQTISEIYWCYATKHVIKTHQLSVRRPQGEIFRSVTDWRNKVIPVH